MNKKILIFSTAYFPFVGGAEVAMKEITNRFAPLGENWMTSGGRPAISFDMVTAKMDAKLPKFEKIGNVNVYRIGVGIPLLDKLILVFWGSRFAQKLHNKIKNAQANKGTNPQSSGYSAVWALMASYGGFAALSFKKKNPSVPFLLTLQEGDPFDYIQKRARWMMGRFKQIFIKADYIQAISHYLAEWARKMGAKCPVSVVPNGVDIKNFTRVFAKEELVKLKKEIKLASCFQIVKTNKTGNESGTGPFICEDDKIIVTVSRLVEKNAVDDVISALRHLPENYKFLILGIGQEMEKYAAMVAEFGLQKRVSFAGQIEHKDLPKYLAISDVFVRPSRSEGLGNVFLEAMAAGLPVIGTPVGGIPDFLCDPSTGSGQGREIPQTPFNKGGTDTHATGLFCKVDDPKSIAEKIKFILASENAALKEKIIANGRALVIKDYNWDTIAEKMREIFEKLK